MLIHFGDGSMKKQEAKLLCRRFRLVGIDAYLDMKNINPPIYPYFESEDNYDYAVCIGTIRFYNEEDISSDILKLIATTFVRRIE
jgi:hypothetical protein